MSFAYFQETAKEAALASLKNGPELVQELQVLYQQHFTSPTPQQQLLSVLRQEYASKNDNVMAPNESLNGALTATMDATQCALHNLAILEQYITLTIPKMEDGGNFGVTVQLAGIKHIQTVTEALTKGLEELSKYDSQRADALEKCKLPSSSTTKTTTTSESKTEGEEKGESKNAQESKQSTENKTCETMTTQLSESEFALRQQAVVNVDVLFYAKSKALFQQSLTGLLAAYDFCDKNAKKIEHPKGANYNNGAGYSSMY